MPKLHRSDKFVENAKRLLAKGVLTREQMEKFLRLMAENPLHPSLRTRKMAGTRDIFEASVNMGIWVTFHYVKPDTIYLRNVGEHDMTLKRK